MTKYLLIGFGGSIGAIGRYALSGLVHKFAETLFPYGTRFIADSLF